MLKNQFDREMQNPLSRKLQCRCQIDILDFQIANCRSSSQGKASLIHLGLCSVETRRNIQVSLAQYAYGRLVTSPFFNSCLTALCFALVILDCVEVIYSLRL
ncbi:hypothetical protein OWV82_020219 [Melia azedarach]|uniref:Uncharacterized protein n=1 Tax=Melia azedarach TaxID=155640 RepID=A0ACC1X6K9_MELAZ|nr:hypothetical protein OWV82_020219 [Melia azedarach]